MINIEKLLNESSATEWKINGTKTESYELFFVHSKLETVRATETNAINVTVYSDHDEKKGQASFKLYASTTEGEARAKIDSALEKAALISNEYYARPEGETFDGEFLFGAVTNATSVGGLMKLNAEQVVFDDGLFEMILIPNPKTPSELQDLIRSLLTQDYSGTGVVFRHVRELTVQTPECFPWSLDGEYDAGGERVEIRNLNKRLKFLL